MPKRTTKTRRSRKRAPRKKMTKSRKWSSRIASNLTDVFGNPLKAERELQPAKFSQQVDILEEPLLIFRYKQKLEDPRDGLSLFGPYDWEDRYHVTKISYGLVGTIDGIAKFKEFLK